MIDLQMSQEQFVKLYVDSKLLENGYLQARNFEHLRAMMWVFIGTIREMKAVIENDPHVGFGVDPDAFDDFLEEYTKNRSYDRNYIYFPLATF